MTFSRSASRGGGWRTADESTVIADAPPANTTSVRRPESAADGASNPRIPPPRLQLRPLSLRVVVADQVGLLEPDPGTHRGVGQIQHLQRVDLDSAISGFCRDSELSGASNLTALLLGLLERSRV